MSYKLLSHIIFATVAFFALPDASGVVTIQVNSTADEVDDDVTDGVCHTASGVCTLRAAVMTANRETFDTQINLPAGTFTLSIPYSSSDDEGSADLNLMNPPAGTTPEILISGAGSDATIIDGGKIGDVFAVDSMRRAYFSQLTVRNGALPLGSGGGIINAGSLTLADVAVTGNTAEDAAGIYNSGHLYIYVSSISGNAASGYGGGIENIGYLLLQFSVVADNVSDQGGGIANFALGQCYTYVTTIASNTAFTRGGGILNDAMANIDDSTVSNNSAEDGGGIFNDADLIMVNSTVANNAALNNGGGILFDSRGDSNIYNSTIAYNAADSDGDQNGTGGGVFIAAVSGAQQATNIYNTLIAGNTVQASPQPDDCRGTASLYTHANNIFGSTAGCPIVQVSGAYGQLNSLGYLGPLADNGGGTQTVALIYGSSAIDGGYSGGCFDNMSDLIVSDQRGQPRPSGAACDVGAYEYIDAIFKNGFE